MKYLLIIAIVILLVGCKEYECSSKDGSKTKHWQIQTYTGDELTSEQIHRICEITRENQ